MSSESNKLISQALLNMVETHLLKEGDEHTHLKLNIEISKIADLTEIEKLKIEVVEKTLLMYRKYPTLHAVSHYFSSSQDWFSRISQIAWDTVENIKQTEQYQKSSLNMYAFLNNSYNDDIKRQEKNIPVITGDYVTYEEVNQDIKNTFYFLNGEVGKKLYQELRKTEQHNIVIESRNWYGWKNLNLEKDIKNFFGEELLTKLFYFELEESVEKKEEKINKPKI